MTILTPGPVPVPDFVFSAIGQPVIHQRSPAFTEFFSELQAGLRYLFQTENPVLVLPSSGSMAVEMAMRNLFQPGEQIAIQANGKFSDRWLDYASSQGLSAVPMRLPWGENLDLPTLIGVLEAFPQVSGLVLTHCETSTGVQIDLEELAFTAKQIRPELCIVVDAMSSIGVLPLYMDDWKVDVVICASQKGLFNPSGIAFLAMGTGALLRLETPRADDALHLGHYWRYLSQGSFPFTPPTQMLYGIKAALDTIKQQGLPHRWNLSHQISQYFKKEVVKLGGEIFGLGNSDALTAFSLPGEDQDAHRAALYEAGYELAGGQGPLKGKIMRVGHFGWTSVEEAQGLLQAIKNILAHV